VQSRRIDGARALAAPPRSTLVAIGNYDGVHLGHQAVLMDAAALAKRAGLRPVVLTFDPHPAVALGRGALPVLTALDRKVELIARIDPALHVVVEPFTQALSSKSPREFVEELLLAELGASVVAVGENFRFGHDRSGDFATLSELGRTLGFDARAHTLRGDGDGVYSSSRVRRALAEGDLAAVERVLGRPHSVSGTVVEGDRRGRTLGFPTANLAEVCEALPPNGVYACAVDALDAHSNASALAPAVANLGIRPTVSGGFSIEAHLLGFDGDLYGQRLRLHFLAQLRQERRFAGIEELKAQVERDCDRAREVTQQRLGSGVPATGWF
jgi:riboflavin kinase/FMN adenylyltransferase